MPGSGVETDRRTSQLWSSTPAKNALNLEAERPLGEYFPFSTSSNSAKVEVVPSGLNIGSHPNPEEPLGATI
jgi:hypothetical protein